MATGSRRLSAASQSECAVVTSERVRVAAEVRSGGTGLEVWFVVAVCEGRCGVVQMCRRSPCCACLLLSACAHTSPDSLVLLPLSSANHEFYLGTKHDLTPDSSCPPPSAPSSVASCTLPSCAPRRLSAFARYSRWCTWTTPLWTTIWSPASRWGRAKPVSMCGWNGTRVCSGRVQEDQGRCGVDVAPLLRRQACSPRLCILRLVSPPLSHSIHLASHTGIPFCWHPMHLHMALSPCHHRHRPTKPSPERPCTLSLDTLAVLLPHNNLPQNPAKDPAASEVFFLVSHSTRGPPRYVDGLLQRLQVRRGARGRNGGHRGCVCVGGGCGLWAGGLEAGAWGPGAQGNAVGLGPGIVRRG